MDRSHPPPARGTRTKVVFVELTVFQGIMPLASGYMQAFACTSPSIRDGCAFEIHSLVVETPYDKVLAAIRASDGDVYAFSCYLWNIGLVRRLVAALRQSHPRAHVILGGPQVMHHAHRYLDPQDERTVVCNGEGERTFRGFLEQVLRDVPDFALVNGLSFHSRGELVTTAPEPRLERLDDIPSPFLTGVFDRGGPYNWAVLETNRGCPFTCTYCYWGAATGAKVWYFEQRRVEEELEWLGRQGVFYLFIVDANWGISRRDVEISRRLADTKKRFQAPRIVQFCGSKNNPDRVADITEIFHDAGMVTTQSIALQTMSADALANVGRANIKTDTYTVLQRRLNERKISSFIEIIWPLPGETLASFQEGLAKLCALAADSYIIYPLLLMNNVELAAKREEFGLATIPDPDPNSEGELVISTKWVSRSDYDEGVRFAYAVTCLYSLRGLWCLGHYLHHTGRMSYRDLFSAFVEHWRRHRLHPFSDFCEGVIESSEQYKYHSAGGILHVALHAERDGFDRLLESFVCAQGWWDDDRARALFEIDLLNRPYVYSNTGIRAKRPFFRHVRVLETKKTGYVVEVPVGLGDLLQERLMVQGAAQGGVFEVTHQRGQLPYMAGKSLHENFSYCQDMLHKIRSLLPIWSEHTGARAGTPSGARA